MRGTNVGLKKVPWLVSRPEAYVHRVDRRPPEGGPWLTLRRSMPFEGQRGNVLAPIGVVIGHPAAPEVCHWSCLARLSPAFVSHPPLSLGFGQRFQPWYRVSARRSAVSRWAQACLYVILGCPSSAFVPILRACQALHLRQTWGVSDRSALRLFMLLSPFEAEIPELLMSCGS